MLLINVNIDYISKENRFFFIYILYSRVPAVGKRNLSSFKRKNIIERQLKTANWAVFTLKHRYNTHIYNDLFIFACLLKNGIADFEKNNPFAITQKRK